MTTETQTRKRDFLFVVRLGVAEAVRENPLSLLSLDYKDPDRIVAFISPQIHNEITKQLAKNSDLDGVCIRASLSALIQEACEFLEDDQAIENWVKSLEEAIGRLQNYRRERQSSLTALCESCAHPAGEHYRPHLGDVSCGRPDCTCLEFAPLVRVPKSENGPPRLTSTSRGPTVLR